MNHHKPSQARRRTKVTGVSFFGVCGFVLSAALWFSSRIYGLSLVFTSFGLRCRPSNLLLTQRLTHVREPVRIADLRIADQGAETATRRFLGCLRRNRMPHARHRQRVATVYASRQSRSANRDMGAGKLARSAGLHFDGPTNQWRATSLPLEIWDDSCTALGHIRRRGLDGAR